MRMILHVLWMLIHLQIGVATVFWNNPLNPDPFNPNPTNACYQRAPGIPQRLDDHALAFAHKRLPCGTKVLLINPRTGRWVVARRWDWGPKRAMVDVTRAVARALRLNGKEPVILFELR